MSETNPASRSFTPAYKRVLLKISGEAFCRQGESGISMTALEQISVQVQRVVSSGMQLAIVVGGGNILRGREFSASPSINPPTAHYMGMLATVINGLALQDALEYVKIPTRMQSAIRMEGVAEPFIRRRCIRHLEKGRVVVLSGGTGSPFVTTDTAAALRGREIGADVLVKATRVDGIYAADPLKNPHAVRYAEISYDDYLKQNLGVMDAQAIHHCREQNLPIIVFDYKKTGNLERVLSGEKIGSRVVSSAQIGS